VAAFPHIPLPAGVPTSQSFKVTITSVCETEVISGPNLLKDFKLRLEHGLVIATIVEPFNPLYADINNEFCGPLSYTLSETSGYQSLSLLTFD
jgi:hypothetical protein